MTTADEMRDIADALERGAAADIWADSVWVGLWDYATVEEIDRGIATANRTQAAMTRAAALLRQLADPTRQLTDTERAVLRGMLP